MVKNLGVKSRIKQVKMHKVHKIVVHKLVYFIFFSIFAAELKKYYISMKKSFVYGTYC